MSFRHPNDEMIEKYLLHQLPEEEKRQFELQMILNPELRKRVKDYRLLLKSIQTAPKGKPANFQRYGSLILIVTGILLALGALYFSFYSTSEEVYTDEIMSPEVIPAEKESSIKDSISATKPKILDEKKDDTPKNLEEINPISPTKKPETQKNNLIAFHTNPLIEEYYQSNFRGPIGIQLLSPKPQQNISLKNNNGHFLLEGSITGLSDSLAIRALIFNNSKEDFENFKPQFTFSVSSTIENDSLYFKEKINLKTTAGLYYLLLEDAITEEWLIIEKVILK